jgi:membrane protein DedA with SNARE-associated domain
MRSALPALSLVLVQTGRSAPTFLSHLGDSWAYATLGLSSIITEEFAPIVAGLAAYEGHLGLWRAFLAIAIGSWAAGVALYALGRWRGTWVRKRWPRARPQITRALAFVRRHPWRASLLVRFAIGARVVLPIACGAARLRWIIFLVASAISSVVWSAIFVLVGWMFGETALLVLGTVRRYDDYLVALIAIALLVAFIVLRRRSRARPVPDPAERLPGTL